MKSRAEAGCYPTPLAAPAAMGARTDGADVCPTSCSPCSSPSCSSTPSQCGTLTSFEPPFSLDFVDLTGLGAAVGLSIVNLSPRQDAASAERQRTPARPADRLRADGLLVRGRPVAEPAQHLLPLRAAALPRQPRPQRQLPGGPDLAGQSLPLQRLVDIPCELIQGSSSSVLISCSKIDGFLKWQKQHKGYMKFKRSFNYWKECSKKNFCYNGSYIDNYCRKHGTIAVKTIRLKLPDAAELFTTHPHLNLKIIYLARDPRGSINSRTKFPVSQWCKRDPMCINPNHFCSALGVDLRVICTLSKERPEDFMVLRYEDLSIDPFATTTRLVEFLGLQSIPQDTQAFLNSHTSVIGNVREKYRPQGLDYPYSTFRNSSVTAMSWRSQMSFKRVTLLQTTCQTALTGLGYYSYSTAASLRSNLNFDANVDDAVRAFCSAN
ncbi:unnamed protein product [Larinioides sclopetarius]|uniref:Sulfotransferase domain-containing protein n=1 Tax=Larinioides sclopetarius TaxID=280406 RepID=A0AAV2AHE6_9ARAC